MGNFTTLITKYTVFLIGIYVLVACSSTVKTTKPTTSVGQSTSDRNQFIGALRAHNKVRAKHGVGPLKWSNTLAKYSQEWANKLGESGHCKMYHRSGNSPYGENLFQSTAVIWSDGRREVNEVNITEVVKAWTDEEQWYNYKTTGCQRGKQCGHYTQAVWKDTTEVGCAMKVCGDKSQTWVCSYNPPGNYVRVRPY